MFTTTDADSAIRAHGGALPPDTPESPQAGPPLRLAACPRNHPDRAAAEAFVRRAYQRAHGARIATFLPELVLAHDVAGALRGVAGCRGAAREPLFLERYLDGPLESAIAARFRVPVRRADIVEVGNFASTGVPGARRLMAALPSYLHERGFVWIAFTATALLRTLLEDIGAVFSIVAPAHYQPLPCDVDDWGRYYAHDPRVIVGHLPSFRPRRAAPRRRP